jgi:hypothetical protein
LTLFWKDITQSRTIPSAMGYHRDGRIACKWYAKTFQRRVSLNGRGVLPLRLAAGPNVIGQSGPPLHLRWIAKSHTPFDCIEFILTYETPREISTSKTHDTTNFLRKLHG